MRPRYVERQTPNDNTSDADSNEPDNEEEDVHISRSQIVAPSPIGPGEAQEDEKDEDQRSNNSATEQDSASDRSSQAGSKFVDASAVYMPYLEFSMYHRDETQASSNSTNTEDDSQTATVRSLKETKVLDDLERRKSLLNAYKASPFHGPSTLDEFYYHFTDESNEEKSMRNKTQVVTKYLYPNGLEGRNYWSLLRVSQLWIWIVDDRWLISCTSSTMNDEKEDLVTNVLKYLNNEVESGSCHTQPTSANDMSRAIADYCIYTYEKKREVEDGSDMHTETEPEENIGSGEKTIKEATIDGDKGVTSQQLAGRKQRSIRQVYSDYINEIGRRESDLFSLFSDRRRQFKETGYRSFTMEELDSALGEGASQLHRIKDVRDELNILKTIAKYQLAVRSKMTGETRRREDLIAAYVLGDIVELDNNAKQMHDAFISTISLQESELANFQAQQAVKQGKTVMVFTVVTVWFLPLSFLTSLFALDVSSFLQAPAWALVIVFTVPLLFPAAAGVYMYHADKGTKRQRQYFAKTTTARASGVSRPKDISATQEASTYLEPIRKRRSTQLNHDVEKGPDQGSQTRV
jgi:Mg2+ and Co2+ transporter CorA